MTDYVLLSLFKGVTVFLGTLIALLSYVAFRRFGTRLMLYISIGFGLLTAGSIIEGLLFEVYRMPLDTAHMIESSVTLVGLLVLAYHLKPSKPSRGSG